MNILINCSNLKIGGGMQVAQSFVCELRNYPQNTYVILCSDGMHELLPASDFDGNFIFIRYNIKISLHGNNRYLDGIVSKYDIGCVFTVFGPSYWKPKTVHICGFARGHYIYKDSPFIRTMPPVSRAKLLLKEVLHLRAFANSDVLVTENENISKKLARMFPDKKIHTVTNYYNQVFENERSWDKSVTLPHFEGPTLLTVAAPYTHKNLRVIPRVIRVLKDKYPSFNFRFAVSVDRDFWGELPGEIEQHLVCFGKVDIGQCPHLYQQSDFLFLPTLLECFSASYPEAMFMGKPIITSDLGFAHGLCGDAAVYADTLSPEKTADAIYRLATDPDMQKELVRKGRERLKTFDHYSQRAKKYLELINKYSSR